MTTHSFPDWRDKTLFTPGPLITSRTVKYAMLRDLGSHDFEFIEIVRDIRTRLVQLAQVDPDNYTAVLMQGSGTFALESVISSVIPPNGRLGVILNGVYGRRIAEMAEVLNIQTETLVYPENTAPDLKSVEAFVRRHQDLSLLAVVHCETTSGIINPIEGIGALAKEVGIPFFVDAMSSFGAVPIDIEACHIDYLVSSANKCIEGIPGFAFILARCEALEQSRGWARSLSLDLYRQWKGFEGNGQFRFTPPIQTLLAFQQALNELDQEGGVQARAQRYQANYEVLLKGMADIGFTPYVYPENRGYIITSFLYPSHPCFDFNEFYQRLNARDYVIYAGKVNHTNCFRIGNIGRLTTNDINDLLSAIQAVLQDMNIDLSLYTSERCV